MITSNANALLEKHQRKKNRTGYQTHFFSSMKSSKGKNDGKAKKGTNTLIFFSYVDH